MTIIKYTSPTTGFPVGESVQSTDIYLAVDTTDVSPANPTGKLKQYTIEQLKEFNQVNWETVTTGPVDLVSGKGFIANGSGLIIFQLPLTAKKGDEYFIQGLGAGLFKVGQNVGQSIIFDSAITTTGTAGYILSTNRGDGLSILCLEDNTTFKVSEFIGTLSSF